MAAPCNPANPNALNLIDANKANLPQACANSATLSRLISDVFVLLGAIAVLMIVIAGLRYVFARGNPEKMTQARNIIQYSVIGLIISAMAYSIVAVVVDRAG